MGTAEESIRSDMTSRGDEKSRTASICIGTESNGEVWHRHALEQFGKDGRRLARCGNGNAKNRTEKLRKSNGMEVNGSVA